ncbi:MAG: hypothetical protein ACLPM3_12105 [Terracidiphilus sp.]
MMREQYKGFFMNAGAYELQNDLGWSPNLIIEKHYGDSVTATEILTALGVFETRNEAIRAALAHGRGVIDSGFQPDASHMN